MGNAKGVAVSADTGDAGEVGKLDWRLPVRYADECPPCPVCGEPFCDDCGMHYSDCRHPGPHSERDG